jgi:hypothetical protein
MTQSSPSDSELQSGLTASQLTNRVHLLRLEQCFTRFVEATGHRSCNHWGHDMRREAECRAAHPGELPPIKKARGLPMARAKAIRMSPGSRASFDLEIDFALP